MIAELNCTDFQATAGLSVFALGFGVVPLVTASLSEEFGRQLLYFCNRVSTLHCHDRVANNIQTVVVGRFLVGVFGSTGSTTVGDTVADILKPHERGVPMAMFATSAIGATGLGCLAAGWIEQNSHMLDPMDTRHNDRLIRDHGADLHEGDAYFGVPRAPCQEDAQADGQQTSSREGRK
ncbi:hypothetical protein AcW1_006573 [Taiwanofungus camphoratus]|nr:hypothetical protein AcW1_006573 [Antrodia cinnamomea]